jgi:hypothetical protein
MRSAIKRISKIIGGRERWVFMEFVMNKGITVTIDDDEIVSWNHDQKKKAYFIRVKDGSIWCYMLATREFFSLDKYN